MESKIFTTIRTQNVEKITSLVNKGSTATLAELKTGLQDNIRDIETLLEDTTTLRATAQEYEHSIYIQRITNLTLEASAKFLNIKARHRCDVETIELNTFKTSLTNIKHRKSEIFAGIHAQNVEEIISVVNKARALQDTSRAQQCNTGKPSTQTRNLDTALPTIRPDPVPAEEHHDTADREDRGQKEAT